MHINKKNAFTLIELIIVITIIWILIMASTVYFGWSGEKRKVIEWQWCAASIWWEITNYVFYTITSKKLKISDNDFVSPNYYIIQFTWWDTANCESWHECDKIVFSYSTWEDPTNIQNYKIVDSSNTCRQNRQTLKFYWSWSASNYIIMNKWLSPRREGNQQVFYLSWTTRDMSWDIIIWLCLKNDCTELKQIWKFVADARPQTISLKNCRFYDSENPTKCKEREQ